MSQDDFAFEPIRGLPERPPEGEVILWQGQPNWWRLTVESLNIYWVLGYFAFLFAWRFISVSDIMPLEQAFKVSFPFLVLASIVAALLIIVGYIQAKTTVYTITNKRIVMRIGAALTVTLNLPFQKLKMLHLLQDQRVLAVLLLTRPKMLNFLFWFFGLMSAPGTSKSLSLAYDVFRLHLKLLKF